MTVTVKEQSVNLPQGSVTVQVTIVSPIGKKEPDGGLHATVKPYKSSLIVGGG